MALFVNINAQWITGANGIYYNVSGEKVGVGTTYPNSKLHVNSTTGEDGLRVQISGSSKFTVAANGGTSIGSYNNTPPANGLNIYGNTEIGTKATNGATVKIKNYWGDWMQFTHRNTTGYWAFHTNEDYEVFNFRYEKPDGTSVYPLRLTADNRVGINTSSPNASLDVNGNLRVAAPGALWITGKTGTGGITASTPQSASAYHPLLRQTTSSGHVVNLGGLGDYFGFFGYKNNRVDNGYDHGMVMDLNTGNVCIGAGYTSLSSGSHKLAVEGSIGAREVVVLATGWSDFVFNDDYILPSLQEVEAHIAENGHLPDIPSEAEVLENGISVGEMNAKLLQKIEELTLYMIEQQKEIDELRSIVKKN